MFNTHNTPERGQPVVKGREVEDGAGATTQM